MDYDKVVDLLKTTYDELCHVKFDSNVNSVILDGSWPTADEYARRIFYLLPDEKKLEEKKRLEKVFYKFWEENKHKQYAGIESFKEFFDFGVSMR